MPTRATARGTDRTPLRGDWDVLVAGASFAGLTVARELEGTVIGRMLEGEPGAISVV